MSKKPENVFIASVHRHLPDELYKMKNHNTYTAGVFDVWYSAKPKDLWVEYKYLTHIPRSEHIVLDLSELQQQWGADRAAEGRNVWVILGLKDGGIIFHIDEARRIFRQEELLPRVISRREIADWIQPQTMGPHAIPKAVVGPSKRSKRVLSRRVDGLVTVLPVARHTHKSKATLP